MLEYTLSCDHKIPKWALLTGEPDSWTRKVCNHVKLETVLWALIPTWYAKRYAAITCDQCSTKISRLGPDKGDKKTCRLWVQRCLGNGGHAPDKYWCAAVGVHHPENVKPRKPSGKPIERVVANNFARALRRHGYRPASKS